MAEKQTGGPFEVEFTYTQAVLDDFGAMYQQKKELSLPMRLTLGLLGAAGAVYFGLALYRNGLQLTRVGYLVICSLMLLVALSGGGRRPDETLQKYRRYYLDKKAAFKIDENGVEMKLEGQQNYARSKFKEIYGLFDTDRCYYFVIKGKAYYILPRESLGEQDEPLRQYMQKKCAKRFQHYDTQKG